MHSSGWLDDKMALTSEEMAQLFPLHNGVFGYGLSLHDARLKKLEIIPDPQGAAEMTWVIHLHHINGHPYVYELKFSGASGDVEIFSGWVQYFLDDGISGNGDAGFTFTYCGSPAFETKIFNFREVHEVRLEPLSATNLIG